MAMNPDVKRARDALFPGTEPYAALMNLVKARIEAHRDTLEASTTMDEVKAIQGRIAEMKELADLLRPIPGRPAASPPTDY